MKNSLLKLPFVIGSVVFFTSSANAFEFPEKLPYGEISANVNFASSYIWRGEVQNGNNPAIQGGFDYSADVIPDLVSAYAGIWGSPASNSDGYLELDYYGGFSGPVPGLEDFISWDGGVLYYDYPGLTSEASAQDFVEYYGSLGLTLPYGASVGYYYGYSPTGYGGNYDYDYQNVSFEVGIPSTPFSLFSAVGFTGAEEAGKESYTDFNIGLATSALGLDWSVYYTSTSGYSGTGGDDGTSGGGDHVVFTVGAGF